MITLQPLENQAVPRSEIRDEDSLMTLDIKRPGRCTLISDAQGQSELASGAIAMTMEHVPLPIDTKISIGGKKQAAGYLFNIRRQAVEKFLDHRIAIARNCSGDLVVARRLLISGEFQHVPV